MAATGQQCLPLSIDVRQPQTIVAAVEEALKEFKRIDILVNGELLKRTEGRFGTDSTARKGIFLHGGCVCLVVWLMLLWPGSIWAGPGSVEGMGSEEAKTCS